MRQDQSVPIVAERRRSDAIQQILGGHHGLLLREIAAAATRAGTTSISQDGAMKVMAAVAQSLQPVAALPQPKLVPDTLVNISTRFGATRTARLGLGTTSFRSGTRQSRRDHAAGTRVPDLLLRLSIDIINIRAWEEGLLFACERLSRAGSDGLAAVAKVVRVTFEYRRELGRGDYQAQFRSPLERRPRERPALRAGLAPTRRTRSRAGLHGRDWAPRILRCRLAPDHAGRSARSTQGAPRWLGFHAAARR